MRSLSIITILELVVLPIGGGCRSTSNIASREPTVETTAPQEEPAPPVSQPTTPQAKWTAENNPTTRGGRGAPSLDEFFRPAAWVYVDGQAGKFTQREGKPQVGWMIENEVSATPTFRVEAYEPLLGNPKDFACTLHTRESSDGSTIAYAIKAAKNSFVMGKPYSLLHPGDNFVIRNLNTGDVVSEIVPLAPGTYMIAAGIKNLETGKQGLAITFFTVGTH